MKVYLGIDNGVSASIGILDEVGHLLHFGPTPTFSQISYTKTKLRMRTRINCSKLTYLFSELIRNAPTNTYKAFIERPMINNIRFQASISAAASLEATLIALEQCSIGYEYCDSKAWQKMLLPQGCTGPQLKIASRDIGVRMYPSVQGLHTDCDGLLIAEWSRRLKL